MNTERLLSVNEDRDSLLDAATHADPARLRALLARGVAADDPEAEGWEQPLAHAVSHGHTECAKLLVAAGARVNSSMVLWALEALPDGAMARILSGAPAEKKGGQAWGERHRALASSLLVRTCAQSGGPRLLQACLDMGVPADFQLTIGDSRLTPLALAAAVGEEACVEVLLHEKADPSRTAFVAGNHTTPLQLARSAGSSAVELLLRQAGASEPAAQPACAAASSDHASEVAVDASSVGADPSVCAADPADSVHERSANADLRVAKTVMGGYRSPLRSNSNSPSPPASPVCRARLQRWFSTPATE